MKVSLRTYPARRSGPTRLAHRYGIAELESDYQMESETTEEFSPKQITNECIHSFAFLIYSDDEDSNFLNSGFFIASTNNTYRRLVKIPFQSWTDFIEKFIDDRITSERYSFDEDQNRFVSLRKGPLG